MVSIKAELDLPSVIAPLVELELKVLEPLVEPEELEVGTSEN